MKKIYLIACFFLFGQLFAQNTFLKTYDYSGNDVGSFVIKTTDGGYAIIGKTNSLGAGGYDVWLLKTNANGDTLWTKTYGDSLNDAGYCLRQTSDNGFMIAASKTIPNHYTDGWIIKTDANGKVEWDTTFGGELNGEYASFLIPAGNKMFVFSGASNSKSYVSKIDESGNILWQYTYFSNNSSSASAVCQTSDNGYAVVGSFQVFAGGGWYPNFFKLDNSGNLSWQVTYQNTEGSFTRVMEASDGGLILGGSWNGSLGVKKISGSGIEKWEYPYPGDYGTTVTSLIESSDGNILVLDNSPWARLRKLNSQGDTLWIRNKDINNEFIRYANVQIIGNNGLIMAGIGKNDAQNHEVILVKTNEEGSMTGIGSYQAGQRKFVLEQNYPNPFTGFTTLSYTIPKVSGTIPVSINIYNMVGQKIKTLVDSKKAAGTYSIQLHADRLVPGIYFCQLKAGNRIAVKKMILTK